jgi:multiple sugar transport system permease protein
MRRRRHWTVTLVALHIPVALIVLFSLAPYLWSLVTALTPEKDLYTAGFRYFPEAPTLANFGRLFAKIAFGRNILDSLIVAVSTMLVGLAITLSASYSFSRYRFRGRNILLIQFLVINMFPVVLLLIPLFAIMRFLGLLDTHLSLVIAYSTFTIPFATWMMTSFFNAIPRELDESSQIDGCTRLGTMLRIVIPVALPGIAATGIYIFITAWNEFLYAAILGGRRVVTIPIALQLMVGEYQIEWGLLNAGGVISALPVILLFFFIQKQLIGGMTAGAVKG